MKFGTNVETKMSKLKIYTCLGVTPKEIINRLSRSCLFEWRSYIAWNNYHVARPGQPSAPCRWQDGRRDIFGSVGQRHTLIIGYSWEWNRGGHKFDPLSILMQPRDARDKCLCSIYLPYTATRHAATCFLPSGSRHVSSDGAEIEITKMISMPRKY